MVAKAEKRVVPPTPVELNGGGSLICNEKLQQLYAAMLQCRMLAERTQLLTGYAPAVGHEAAEVGCTIDLQKEDMVASDRHAAIADFLYDLPLPAALSKLYQLPATTGKDIPARRGGLRRPSGPNPRQAFEAAGEALGRASAKLDASVELARRCKKTRNVVVAFSAPAGFSDGMWHQALSAAGAKSLPILFVRRDRLSEEGGDVRSSTPKSRSARFGSKPDDARRRSQDYGFPCIPVDGHDVVAVYRVAYESIRRARRGGGPTLIECEPYLLDPPGHSRKVRPANRRTEMDPIRHMERYLDYKGLFRDSWKNQLVEEFSRRLDAAQCLTN